MKKEVIIFLFFLVLPLLSSLEVPNYSNKYVNDFAGMFSDGEILGLQNWLYNLDQNTTAEVSVVIINECGLDYDGFAMQIVDKWKIGKADKDNGLLILYCFDVKKIVVKTGYGLEGILPDSRVGRILDDYYVPLRDSNKTKEGIISAVEQYSNIIEENRAEVISGQAGRKSSNIDYFSIIIWIFLIYFLVSRVFQAIYKNKKKRDLPWFFPILIPFPSRSSSGGFSGGGFSGGGFGGGGFGGGGASR